MTTIRVTDLHSAGSTLFSDSESFLDEVTDEQTVVAVGGVSPWLAVGSAIVITAVGSANLSYNIGRDSVRKGR